MGAAAGPPGRAGLLPPRYTSAPARRVLGTGGQEWHRARRAGLGQCRGLRVPQLTQAPCCEHLPLRTIQHPVHLCGHEDQGRHTWFCHSKRGDPSPAPRLPEPQCPLLGYRCASVSPQPSISAHSCGCQQQAQGRTQRSNWVNASMQVPVIIDVSPSLACLPCAFHLCPRTASVEVRARPLLLEAASRATLRGSPSRPGHLHATPLHEETQDRRV